MKKVMVVDDEQPVVDHLVRLLNRDLSSDFVVVATASSGREALEKAPLLQPDIILMDVRMPGLSGLDAIRELRLRGSSAAFVLSTAYERFDIAREALELGVTGYLLKPVVKDALAQALQTAAVQIDRRSEVELKDFDLREKDLQVKGFVTEAFLSGLMLGRSSGPAADALRGWLGIEKPWGLVGAVVFRGTPEDSHAALEAMIQYKSRALCGPLVAGRCLLFQPLTSPEEAAEAESALRSLLPEGVFRAAFADPRPIDQLDGNWAEALRRLQPSVPQPPRPSRFASRISFEEEEEFHAALVQGDAPRVVYFFESLLAALEGESPVSLRDRYRIIAFLGSALGRLVGLGHLDEEAAHQAMDFDDLLSSSDGYEFCALARSRLPLVMGALSRARRWSPTLSGALEFLRSHYGDPVTLDVVAEHVGVTPKRLSRHFIDELGQGFSDYLIDFRIEKAKLLLAQPGASIKQVSMECGYTDPNYFSRLFKKVTGATPTEFSGSR